MAPRSELHTLLTGLLPEGKKAYFQPPPNVQMEYPCIIYSRDNVDISHADNLPYRHEKRYQITVVDPDPDSEIPDKVAMLPSCSFSRAFAADNLNHDVYTIYF